jgi:hypothetical protein
LCTLLGISHTKGNLWNPDDPFHDSQIFDFRSRARRSNLELFTSCWIADAILRRLLAHLRSSVGAAGCAESLFRTITVPLWPPLPARQISPYSFIFYTAPNGAIYIRSTVAYKCRTVRMALHK